MDKSKIEFHKGIPHPLGATSIDKGTNFALFSKHASAVKLCLFTPRAAHPFFEISLSPHDNRTGQVWHVLLTGLPSQVEYGWRLAGPYRPKKGILFNPTLLLSDPYAKSLATTHHWGTYDPSDKPYAPRGRVVTPNAFDWQNDHPPKIAWKDLVIYEMHVRGFTQHPSSHANHPGTFLGVVEKIPYLQSLGVNAVELLPIFEFNECEHSMKNPKTHARLFNFWGYSTVNFFSPMNRFATSSEWESARQECKTMIRELHKAHIEVILDVVFNHTAEGNEKGPTLSFKGIDNAIYYLLDKDGQYANYSGTGNSLNANHPVVSRLILDSLRFWVSEMHVDGFRFDLASALTRDTQGHPMAHSLLVSSITHDPILAHTKLIAEAWDAAGLYQVGSFPGEGRWAEWNGKYRDRVRRFIKGTAGCAGEFASALTGSQDVYGKDRKPTHSINFTTCHDGFTLRDLVSYQQKHNEENGEENRDGANDNESWNCGEEGVTKQRNVLMLRERQMRNLHTALLCSIGTPMLLMGDEYGHTKGGNNNTWCHDDARNWFLWEEAKPSKGFFRFYHLMIQFRKNEPLLRRESFLADCDVDWHGPTPLHPDWGAESRFVAYTLKAPTHNHALYIAFNAHFKAVRLTLPPPPPSTTWRRIVDTSLAPPEDFSLQPPGLKHTYDLPPYSALVAKAQD